MTRDKAIAELVRIWHSPHLDLSLKAGLAEAIDTLKESNLNDSLVRGEVDACKESESKLDLISRQDAIERVLNTGHTYNVKENLVFILRTLPSAEPQPKPISYIECANAMLKMWIDNVLTDGEYYRIMEKLNSKHMADMRGGDDSE